EDNEVGEYQQLRALAAFGVLVGADGADDGACSLSGRGGRVDQIGGPGPPPEGDGHMGEHRYQWLTLWGSGSDGRSLDREVRAFEIDVVHLAPVNEAASGDVANFGIVLPAVPKSTDYLDEVGRLVKEVVDQRGVGRALFTIRLRSGDRPSTELSSLQLGGRHPRVKARPPIAHVVECGDGLG